MTVLTRFRRGIEKGAVNAMRVVVIGAGRMGSIRAHDLAADDRVSELLIANRTGERADALARELGAQSIAWEHVARTDADGYVMALATDAHAALLERLLRHGKPLLCEKPIALSISETEHICALAADNSAPLQIGFQRRFDPAFEQARLAIDSGALGTIYDLAVTSRDHTPPDRFFLPGSGGIFRDLHVHDLDLIAWLTSSPIESVQAAAEIRGEGPYAEFGDFDTTRITARTESGVLASICGSRHDARGHDVRLEVFGSKDALSAGITPRTPLRVLDDPGVAVDQDPYTGFIDRFRAAFRSETRSFVDLIEGAQNPCPPQAATESLRAAIACEIAVREGRRVAVRDVRDVRDE
jgi:myo-inositol 2-dehydrogenase/D-chiro-inositol 1-dehydrogenase